MTNLLFCVVFVLTFLGCSCDDVFDKDWLVDDVSIPSIVKWFKGGFLMSNGLISREFVTYPDFATIDLRDDHSTNSSLFRFVSPEAEIYLDGLKYTVGGFKPNTSDIYCTKAYFNRTACLNGATRLKNGFHYSGGYEIREISAPFQYTPARGAPGDIIWPPRGKRLDVTFKAPDNAPPVYKDVTVVIHYEIYDGIPAMSKWISVESREEVILTFGHIEALHLNRPWYQQVYESSRLGPQNVGWFYVETDQAHGSAVSWSMLDSNVPGSFEAFVNVSYTSPYTVYLKGRFESAHVHELIIGPSDLQRATLARRRMFRVLAPHTQENPLFFHMTQTDSQQVRAVVDQMFDVGFEMLVYGFGSGMDIESTDERYIAKVAADVAFAKSRGLEVGAYDLIALSRGANKAWMATDAKNKSIGSVCMASEWYDYLTERIYNFFQKTGMTMIETDGPYGGYGCHSREHRHHHGYEDSVYAQMKRQSDMYLNIRSKRWYLNQPDQFFYQGGSRTSMGYIDGQFTLSRWLDLAISRQTLHLDTLFHIPSSGWMVVPLVGHGKEANMEPLSSHLHQYNFSLAQYMSSGSAACYYGKRLYDNTTTRDVVKKWVDFYKTYRDILNSELIHVRYPNMQDIDAFMHVNPRLKVKALAVIFNPTNKDITSDLILPLYYSGLRDVCEISHAGMPFATLKIDRYDRIRIRLQLSPKEITWFALRAVA